MARWGALLLKASVQVQYVSYCITGKALQLSLSGMTDLFSATLFQGPKLHATNSSEHYSLKPSTTSVYLVIYHAKHGATLYSDQFNVLQK